VAKTRIGGIIQRAQLSELRVLSAPDRPGTAAALLRAFGDAGVNVQFIAQCLDARTQGHIVLCVDSADREQALSLAERARADIGAEQVRVTAEVALISIFGPDFRERPGIAAQMFDALAAEDINIVAISTSISTVSCIIQHADLEKAGQALRRVFELP
jgi:aspartokinase